MRNGRILKGMEGGKIYPCTRRGRKLLNGEKSRERNITLYCAIQKTGDGIVKGGPEETTTRKARKMKTRTSNLACPFSVNRGGKGRSDGEEKGGELGGPSCRRKPSRRKRRGRKREQRLLPGNNPRLSSIREQKVREGWEQINVELGPFTERVPRNNHQNQGTNKGNESTTFQKKRSSAQRKAVLQLRTQERSSIT